MIGNKCHVVRPAHAARAERQRLAVHRANPGLRVALHRDHDGRFDDPLGREFEPVARRVDQLLRNVGLAQLAGQHQRAVHHRRQVGIVGHGAQPQLHWHRHFDFGLLAPGASDRQERAGLRGHRLVPAVDRQRHALRRPTGHAQAQLELNRSLRPDRQSRRRHFGELRVLTYGNALVLPAQFAGDEQVHPERLVVVEVDRVGVLGVILQAGAGAAPERVTRRVEVLPMPRRQRDEVHHHPGARVLRRQDRVDQVPLVVVDMLGARLPGEQVTRQPEHVVGATSLLRVRIELIGQMIRVAAPVLVDGGSAGAVGPAVDDAAPEELGDVPVRRIARQFVLAGGADHVGDERVDMQPLQLVAMQNQRVVVCVGVEPLGQLQPGPFACDAVEVGESLVHAALLGVVEHLLHGGAVEPVEPALGPPRHALGDLKRLGVVAVHIHVDQAGVDLMQRVPGRPDLLQRDHAIDLLLGVGAEVARTKGFLALRQLGDDRIGFGLELLVPGGGDHQRAGGEVMAHGVPAQLRLLPAAHRLAGRRQSGCLAEVPQQAVRLQLVQVPPVALHRLAEGAIEQLHIAQIERPRLQRDHLPPAGPHRRIDVVKPRKDNEDHDENAVSAGHVRIPPWHHQSYTVGAARHRHPAYTRRRRLRKAQIAQADPQFPRAVAYVWQPQARRTARSDAVRRYPITGTLQSAIPKRYRV